MVPAKQLIELNNQKRTELTPENEQYYSDFLIYVRLHFLLSEQQTEEILMEILDHLIEGQNDGKSAQMIFGNDPKRYADEIIKQIPHEDKRNLLKFVFSGVVLHFLAWYLMTQGVIIFIVSFFKKMNVEVNLFKSTLILAVIVGSCLFFIWFLFKLVRSTLFVEKKKNGLNTFKAGSVGAICTGLIIVISRFVPNIGPSFHFTWYASLIIGAIIWGISRVLKN